VLTLLLSAWIVRDFLLAIVVAGFLATLLQPLRVRLDHKLGRHPKLFSLLFTFGVFLLILTPLALLGFLVLTELLHAARLAHAALGADGFAHLFHGRLPAPLSSVMSRVERIVPVNVEAIRKQLSGLTKLIAPTLGGILTFSGTTAFDLFITLFAFFYFTLDGKRLLAWIAELLPLRARYAEELFVEFHNVSFAMVVGSIVNMLLAGVAASVGYLILGVEDPVVWGSLTGLLSIAPAVGTALVWVPVVIVVALTGHLLNAVLLTGYCLLVLVLGVDNLLRPFLVGKRMTLHPLLILLGILGGATTFGLSGLILGPIVLSLAVAVLRIYQRDFLCDPATTGEAPPR
jgi:predicted PurR-regulated permease PerM